MDPYTLSYFAGHSDFGTTALRTSVGAKRRRGRAGRRVGIVLGTPGNTIFKRRSGKPDNVMLNQEMGGTPGPIRTADLLLRRQTLYPAELRAHETPFSVARGAKRDCVTMRYKASGNLKGEVAEWSKAAVC